MKFATKPIRHYPPHLRDVATASCCVVAFGGYINCVCAPQLFQQLINTMLCPAFFRKFVCQPLCCVPLKYKLFYQNLVFVAEYHVVC